LDANILLDFYRYGDDDIVEMGKLVVLIRDGEIDLHINSHLENEINRNREKVLAESFSELKAAKYKVRAPNYCSQLPELKELNERLKAANLAHDALVSVVESRIRDRKLPADRLISAMFQHARVQTH
jgi:predicted nucleic acid-binding protein